MVKFISSLKQMRLEHILEEYALCVFVETITVVLSKMGKIDPDTGKKFDIQTILERYLSLTSLKKDPLRSPLVRAFLCLSVAIARDKMQKRRRKRD